jgi:hypothetical protein
MNLKEKQTLKYSVLKTSWSALNKRLASLTYLKWKFLAYSESLSKPELKHEVVLNELQMVLVNFGLQEDDAEN